jgi:hypothetical protein
MPATIPEAVKRIFTESFIARDIAEPLASFDESASSTDVRDYMTARSCPAVGVRREGTLVGYVETGALENGVSGNCGQYARSFSEAPVLDEETPLLNVLTEMNHAPFLFIKVLGAAGGIITPADLQKPPVRMWIFGIVSLIEMRCLELIEEHCPADSWREFLSEGRLRKAQEFLAERKRRNQTVRLLDCLYFADKGRIIARHEGIRSHTMFSSRRQAEEAITKLEQLRNNIAHSHDLSTSDLETVAQLCQLLAPVK